VCEVCLLFSCHYEISLCDLCVLLVNFRTRFPYEIVCFLLHSFLTRFPKEISCFLAVMRYVLMKFVASCCILSLWDVVLSGRYEMSLWDFVFWCTIFLRDILIRFHAFWALRVSRKILHTFWPLCDFLMRFHAFWLPNFLFDGVIVRTVERWMWM
jgi:hypothetical protein